jgi:nucleotide-binding universal stress UspA family protein
MTVLAALFKGGGGHFETGGLLHEFGIPKTLLSARYCIRIGYFLFSKVLVATDFSENANRAVDYAVDLAEKLHASVTILNVVQNKLPFGMSGAEIAVVRGEDYLLGVKRVNEGKIASSIEKFKKQHNSLSISSIVKIGNPVQEILSEAKKFDILVIGHKGESNLLMQFTGTTSERILHSAKIPVLVIP